MESCLAFHPQHLLSNFAGVERVKKASLDGYDWYHMSDNKRMHKLLSCWTGKVKIGGKTYLTFYPGKLLFIFVQQGRVGISTLGLGAEIPMTA